tara:strand:- start:182 stop:349 length:168 start_codon:yes stop_codon:yes gene_type:complete
MEKFIQFWNWLFKKTTTDEKTTKIVKPPKKNNVKSSWETNKGRPAPKRRGRPKKK